MQWLHRFSCNCCCPIRDTNHVLSIGFFISYIFVFKLYLLLFFFSYVFFYTLCSYLSAPLPVLFYFLHVVCLCVCVCVCVCVLSTKLLSLRSQPRVWQNVKCRPRNDDTTRLEAGILLFHPLPGILLQPPHNRGSQSNDFPVDVGGVGTKQLPPFWYSSTSPTRDRGTVRIFLTHHLLAGSRLDRD